MVVMDRGETKAVYLWNWDLYTKSPQSSNSDNFIKDGVYVYEPLEGKLDISPDGKKQWSSKERCKKGYGQYFNHKIEYC